MQGGDDLGRQHSLGAALCVVQPNDGGQLDRWVTLGWGPSRELAAAATGRRGQRWVGASTFMLGMATAPDAGQPSSSLPYSERLIVADRGPERGMPVLHSALFQAPAPLSSTLPGCGPQSLGGCTIASRRRRRRHRRWRPRPPGAAPPGASSVATARRSRQTPLRRSRCMGAGAGGVPAVVTPLGQRQLHSRKLKLGFRRERWPRARVAHPAPLFGRRRTAKWTVGTGGLASS